MIKYSVIESQRKVIARIDNCENDAYNVLSKACKGKLLITEYAVKIAPKFTAVAKCHPDDTFDVEEGKKIARERVIKKYNKAMARVLAEFECVLDSCWDNIDEVFYRYQNF